MTLGKFLCLAEPQVPNAVIALTTVIYCEEEMQQCKSGAFACASHRTRGATHKYRVMFLNQCFLVVM